MTHHLIFCWVSFLYFLYDDFFCHNTIWLFRLKNEALEGLVPFLKSTGLHKVHISDFWAISEGSKSDLIPEEPLCFEEITSLLQTYPTVQASVTLQWGLEASWMDAGRWVLCAHAPCDQTFQIGQDRGGFSRMYVAEIGTVSHKLGWLVVYTLL